MARPRIRPFFKVLNTDFTRRLTLPPYLVLKHGSVLPKYVRLRMSNGGTWDVKIRKTEDGNRCLTRGWSEFAKDVKLVEGDYVCFHPCIDGLTLDVVVFGTNWYEKKMEVSDDGSESSKDSDTDSDCVGFPYFEMQLKAWQEARLPLSKVFVEKANLIGRTQVILEYAPTKQTCPVALDHRSERIAKISFRFDLAKGWYKFQKENGMKVGKTYSFTFDPIRDVIQVKQKRPPYLVLKHGNIFPKYVKLRVSTGVTWGVKIKKTTDEDRCLMRGWGEFVKDFVEKAHLIGKTRVILEYAPTKKTWPVALDHHTNKRSFRFDIAKGWQKFKKINGIKVGKAYSFTFNPIRDVIKVRPLLTR